MPDFLTRRNGTWHFVRRAPLEFAAFDTRGVIRHSTKIKVSQDRTGRRATRVVERFNSELEAQWRLLASDKLSAAAQGYDDARRRARSLGFDYVENDEIVQFPWEKHIERIEALITQKLENDRGARTALLGLKSRPSFMLSRLVDEYVGLKPGWSPIPVRSSASSSISSSSTVSRTKACQLSDFNFWLV